MATQKRKGPPIYTGYTWQADITVTASMFPVGCLLRAELRASRSASSPVIGELTTQAGRLVRQSDTTLRVIIPASISAAMQPGTVVFLDFVRTDTPEPSPLGIALRIPVRLPVTRPAP